MGCCKANTRAAKTIAMATATVTVASAFADVSVLLSELPSCFVGAPGCHFAEAGTSVSQSSKPVKAARYMHTWGGRASKRMTILCTHLLCSSASQRLLDVGFEAWAAIPFDKPCIAEATLASRAQLATNMRPLIMNGGSSLHTHKLRETDARNLPVQCFGCPDY